VGKMKKIFFWGAFLLLLLYFNLFLIPADLHKSVFDKPVYSDTTENFSVSGLVFYKGSSQPVNAGYVKALMYDWVKDDIFTIDSAGIGLDGSYFLPKVHNDTTFIMAYGDDELLDFTPGYHDTTIYWQSSIILKPSANINNANISVNRIIKQENGEHHINGRIMKEPNNPNGPIEKAIVYAKIGSKFKGFGISDENGFYNIDSLPSGNFEIIAERIGYYSDYRYIQIGQFNTDTVNFYLARVSSTGPPPKKIPKEFALYTNFPNPFNPVTKIKFDIPASSLTHGERQGVRLVIYDILGKEIATLVNQQLKPGIYEIEWDASNYPSGVYFYKLITEDFTETRKMVLIK
jgi:hypothetical protein